MKKSYTAGIKPYARRADMTTERLNVDILPITDLSRIVGTTPSHDDRQQQQKRQQQPRKQEKFVPVPVYTPDGHLEEEKVSRSKIDVVA
jgi:hypothetical protein